MSPPPGDAAMIPRSQWGEVELDKSTKDHIDDFLSQVEDHCKNICLEFSLIGIQRLRGSLQAKVTQGQMAAALDELDRRIRDEMGTRLFMFVPSDMAKFYDKKELFGPDVNAAFPSVQFDVVEAGNCYAAGRATACVFHLMRIMEIGVQEFGTRLGVSLVNEKNWQNILDEINKAIKGLPPKDPKTVEKSEAAANLYSVKLAWRNQVMHPKGIYTLEEAKNLINLVGVFMRQLAKL